jgi:serpin B
MESMETLSSSDKDYWKHIVESTNQFGVAALSGIAPNYPTGNVLISPTSIFLALSMLYNGASGATYEELKKVLQLPLPSEINPWNRQLLSYIRSPKPCHEVYLANALWFQMGLKCHERFVQDCMSAYGSKFYGVDFASFECLEQINYWAQVHSEDQVPYVVNALDPGIAFAISDMVHFYAQFARPFASEILVQRPFYRVGAPPKPVDMMQMTEPLPYFEDGSCHGLKLAYNSSPYYLMLVLPKPGAHLGLCLNHLLSPNSLFQANSTAAINVQLPRMNLAFDVCLKKYLPALGLSNFLLQDNDLALIAPNLKLGSLIHKSVLRVDEKAAPGSQPFQGSFDFTLEFNRPFLLAVVDATTGQVITSGAVFEP